MIRIHCDCSECAELFAIAEAQEREVERLRAENFSMRATLDGEPCNEDWRTEAFDMSEFAGKCMDERDAKREALKRAEAKIALMQPLADAAIELAESTIGNDLTPIFERIERARAALAQGDKAE